jgi:hypothetical protein
VLDAIVEALNEVYEFNRHRHNEDAGDDAQTFGFLVYRNGWAAIEERLATVPEVRTSRPRNSLLIALDGGKRLRTYRGGGEDEYDIDDFDPESGTFTKRSVSAANTRQLSLFDCHGVDEDAFSHLADLMIVHVGNPEVGLTGVWIGAPALQEDTASPWAFVGQVFPSTGAATLAPGDRAVPPAPSPFNERIAPVVRLEPRPGSKESTVDPA